jgi:hypothetical protein
MNSHDVVGGESLIALPSASEAQSFELVPMDSRSLTAAVPLAERVTRPL